jgi:hypothetical protein
MAAAGAAAGSGGRKPIADLYERWTLDIIPCLGQPCGVLCRDYPQEFKNVPVATLVTLADLLYRTGHDSTYLDEQGRKALIMPVLGDSDGYKGREGSGPFQRSAEALRSRAKDFVQRVFTTGEDQLRDAFRDAVISFQKYLTTVDGNVLNDANTRYKKHFDDVVTILQTKDFGAGLGLPPAPSGAPRTWPLGNDVDGDGAMLVHAVSRRAQGTAGKPIVTDEEFMQMQRIAFYGAETIQAVLTDAKILTDKDPKVSNDAADGAISLTYRWWTAIAELTAMPATNGPARPAYAYGQ